jgi:hypothetical protein
MGHHISVLIMTKETAARSKGRPKFGPVSEACKAILL